MPGQAWLLYIGQVNTGFLRKQPGLVTRRVDWHLKAFKFAYVEVTFELKFIRVHLNQVVVHYVTLN